MCGEWKSFPSATAVCTLMPANRTLIVSKGFQSGPGTEGAELNWIVPFMTNPSTLEETESFKFWTMDQYHNLID